MHICDYALFLFVHCSSLLTPSSSPINPFWWHVVISCYYHLPPCPELYLSASSPDYFGVCHWDSFTQIDPILWPHSLSITLTCPHFPTPVGSFFFTDSPLLLYLCAMSLDDWELCCLLAVMYEYCRMYQHTVSTSAVLTSFWYSGPL